MHAKISLLAWSDHVRVIIGSANLTKDGYRRNQECVAAIDFDASFTDRGLLDPLLAYLRELLSLTVGPARARAEQLLLSVDEQLPRHTAGAKGILRRLILIGPGRANLFDQLGLHLPTAPAGEAHVVSPFFDVKPRQNGPERVLWSMMKQRGAAALHLHVAGEEAPESKRWRLAVPQHLLNATPKGRQGVVTELHPVQVANVPTDLGADRRPLHAKMLSLSHETWTATVIGSSNFTSAGVGLSPIARNWEANVLYLLRAHEGDGARRLLEARGLRGGEAVDLSVGVDFEPAIDPDGEESDAPPPLPAFFAEATLDAAGPQSYELRIEFAGAAPKGGWTVRQDLVTLADHASWFSQGQPTSMRVALRREGPPPAMLTVHWGNAAHVSPWPVNVVSAEVLPSPTELQGLSLAALLDLLSSARPLHEALRVWLRRQPSDDDANVDDVVELVDPHAKVDTSGFLVKRVQRACWAMRQLREKLEQPVLSTAAMAWRMNGPVGAAAVLEAMQRQCDPGLPDEWAFLMCEMWRELSEVQLQGASGRPPPQEAQQLLSDFLAALHTRIGQAIHACSARMQSYVSEAMRGNVNATA
jgi:hypothetical protein